MRGNETVEARVRTLIEERLTISVVSADTDMIESGLLDSLALVTLIAAIEDAFDCELPLEDFDPDRFRTITGIADFVRSAGVDEPRAAGGSGR